MVAKDLDSIMSDCDEGLPWQSVVEQLGKYWLQREAPQVNRS